METLFTRVTAAKQRIQEATEELIAIRAECSHPSEVVESAERRINDEYDQFPHYSRFFTCQLCGASWSKEVK